MSPGKGERVIKSIFLGTSGWSYPDFQESLYRNVPRRAWLTQYASQFNAVEINASYYRLQTQSTFSKWREQTPEHFRFSIKANRYLINRRLSDPEEPIAHERDRATALGDKLAAVLWQLPRRFEKDLGRLQRFADALIAWPDVPQVLEFRHRSWFADDVGRCLREHGLANCVSDAADWPMWDEVTSDVVYVRLHGHTRTYASAYSASSLERWAERARHWCDAGYTVHVYFDNTAGGSAVRDARCVCQLLQ